MEKTAYTSKMEPSKASSTENRKSEHKLSRIEIEVHHGGKGEVTGHTVHHSYMPTKSKKSAAFMEMPERESYVFDGAGHSSTHGHLADHLAEHMPHVFGETSGGKKGSIEAENMKGEGDDDEQDEYV